MALVLHFLDFCLGAGLWFFCEEGVPEGLLAGHSLAGVEMQKSFDEIDGGFVDGGTILLEVGGYLIGVWLPGSQVLQVLVGLIGLLSYLDVVGLEIAHELVNPFNLGVLGLLYS